MLQKVVVGSRAIILDLCLTRLAAVVHQRWSCFLAGGLLLLTLVTLTPAAATSGATPKLTRAVQLQSGLGRNFVFTHITTEQGLSDQRVQAVLQDRAGFIWFGTNNGLNRYDGYNIVAYRNDPANPHSLSGNLIEALYEDRSGMLWVATRAGLNAFDRRTEQFTRYRNNPADPHSLSDNTVVAIYEDRAGVLWLGTYGGLNRFDRATGTFTAYRHNPADPHSLSHDRVRAIYEDRAGVLWVGTFGGLNRFDRATGTFTAYRHDPADPRSLSHDVVWDIRQDRFGVLWVGTDGGGLNRFDPSTSSETGQVGLRAGPATNGFSHYRHEPNDLNSLISDRIDCLFEDATGALWIGTFGGGLSVLDPARQSFTTYGHDSTLPASLSNNYIVDITSDRSGLVFIGTLGSGVDIYNPQQQAFTIYRHDPKLDNSLASDNISAVYEDPEGILWLGTQDGGLDRFDRQQGQIAHYPPAPETPQRLGHPFVSALEQDQRGALWVGTYGGGLYRLDPASGNFTAYRNDPANPRSLSHNAITDLHFDRSGVLWVATTGGGLNRFDPASNTFTPYRNDPANPQSLSSDSLWTITEDQQGSLWIGALGGGLNRLESATGQITRYQHDPDDPASLSDDTIWPIHIDRSGMIWVGTFGGGLNRFDPTQGSFTHYREADGLASDRIVAILEDGEADDPEAGNLWITTGRGLSKLDRDRQTFHTYDTADGLPLTEYNRGVYKTRSGELLLSSLDGLIAFDPAAVRDDSYVPPIVFTGLLLANQPVVIGQDSLLQQAIDQLDTLELTYADQVISFEFAALSYHAPRQNRYRYQLEGFDPTWTEVDSTRRLVTYTNLDPGRYIFRVTGSNGDGVWNETGRTLTLIIEPPWWATWWFRSLAAGLVIGAVVTAFIWRVNNLRAQQRRLEALVAERTGELAAKNEALEVANQAKGAFLATMSHELRTPLHAILGYAQLIARDRELAPEQRENLTIIRRSGEHLLGLINNILDLSKVEAGRMSLAETNFDLYLLLNELETMFRPGAADKGLRLWVDRTREAPRYIRADRVKLRQVLINLLGNAVKFTQAGEVALHILTSRQSFEAGNEPASHYPPVLVIFQVRDTGPGIPADEQEQIFDAFVQTSAGQQAREGTGLGLAISRQYVQLMGGTLSVQSERGQGAVFTMAIPLQLVAVAEPETQPDSLQVMGLAPGQPHIRILVVDDKRDNRQLLVELLTPLGFELREAQDGQEAVVSTRTWQPHLILLDLRMPRLDGYGAARQIKSEASERAPVIIALSASAPQHESEQVLAAGCDLFIRKPFRPDEFIETIGRQLGVSYLYTEAQTVVPAATPEGVRPLEPGLISEALATLPVETVTALEQALVEANPSLVGQRIAQLRDYNPALAEALAALAAEFEYTRILAHIQAKRG